MERNKPIDYQFQCQSNMDKLFNLLNYFFGNDCQFIHKGQFSNTSLEDCQLHCLSGVCYIMYFILFFCLSLSWIINVFGVLELMGNLDEIPTIHPGKLLDFENSISGG